MAAYPIILTSLTLLSTVSKEIKTSEVGSNHRALNSALKLKLGEYVYDSKSGNPPNAYSNIFV